MKRLGGVQRGEPVTVTVDGEPVSAFSGETIAAALLVSGKRIMRRTYREGAVRGIFCGMGICFDCVVTVDGNRRVRSCLTSVTNAMSISTQE